MSRLDPRMPPPPPEAAWLALTAVAAPDEPAEDRAVFDAGCRESLPPERKSEATLVHEALELCSQGECSVALDRLAPIGRKSAFADWRLFARGLVAFQHANLGAAREAWSRLDTRRRPARIAAVLGRAWEEARAGAGNGDSAPAGDPAGAVPHAAAVALLRRASLWTAADEIAAVKHRGEERPFSATQAALAIRLGRRYAALDPAFVSEFSAACRALSLALPEGEPLAALCRDTAGPPHDPHCAGLRLAHLGMYGGSIEEFGRVAREYVDRDLPGLPHVPAPFREALASVMLERTAAVLGEQAELDPFGGLTPEEERQREAMLREAIKRHPANRRAHQSLLDLLADRSGADDPDSDAARALTNAQVAFVKLFPDESETAGDVIDRLLEAGDFERAEPLVKSLADRRGGDTKARSIPWRFELLRAAARAASPESPPRARTALEAALAAWPEWMSRSWIPFLEAALLLREGNEAGFQAACAAARRESTDDLTADVMLYEAVVRFHGPEPVTAALAARLRDAARGFAIDAPIQKLVNAAGFWMELERVGLALGGADHPAFALGRALCRRLAAGDTRRLSGIIGNRIALPLEDPGFWAAFRWLARHDFCGVVNPAREPKGITRLADSHPRAAAEVLEWLTRVAPDRLTSRKVAKRIALVEKFLATEQHPAVHQRLSAIVAAARETADEIGRQMPKPGFRGPHDFFFSLPDRAAPAPDLPPILQLVLDRGGPAAVAAFVGLLMGPKNRRTAGLIRRFAAELGLAEAEVMAALEATPEPFPPQRSRHDA